MNPEHITAQVLLRAWPFPRGSGRLIDKFFAKAQFSKQVAEVKTTDGFQISVCPNDLIGRHIYLTGEFDRSTVEVLCDLSKPGDTLLDVGANIGYVSACFLANVSGSRVISVEPQAALVGLLQQNLSQFGARYQVIPAALSNKTGEGWMMPCADNPGAGSLIQERTGEAVQVDLWSADRLFSSAKIDKLDLVKIDVEGHEEEVISACIEQFRRLRPRAILFETLTNKAAPDGEIGSILKSIGYDIFGVKKRLTRIEMPPIKTRGDCVYLDYVAMKR